jgi:Kef-type K+ transport system membrane component KefB
VALGFVLGPQVLDLVGGDMLGAFEPVVQVALGWLAFTLGLDFGYAGERRVRASSFALATFGALTTGAAVAAASWAVMRVIPVPGTPHDHLLLAGGVGAACSETTPHAVRWIVERHNARGPLADRLNEIAHADDLFPLLAVALLFALEPTRGVVVNLPLRDWPTITIILGLVLGAGAALLVRSDLPTEDTWVVLFGVSLIAIGTSGRLGLSTLAASFFTGLAVSALSQHRQELRAMVAPTERPVLLPALLLAGARLDFRASPALLWIAAAAVGARLAAKVLVGWALAATSAPARRGGMLVGLSLMSSGVLAMSIGLAFALRFPGAVGDTILSVAAVAVTVGEFVGPARVRRTLHAAGEIEDAPAAAASGEATA